MEHKKRLPTYFDMVRENLGTDDPLEDGTEEAAAEPTPSASALSSPTKPRKKLVFWEFSPQLVFCRYDKFIARLDLIMVSCFD